MSDVLTATIRQSRGSRAARREREQGLIPAILYGHGEDNVALSFRADEVDAAMRHGGQVVDLSGEVTDSALIRDVQWDTFGMRVLHLDLTRVSAGEVVEVTIALELRGEAPGSREGGIVDQHLHEVDVECPVRVIPSEIEVNINHLNLGDSILAADLRLPEGVKLMTDPEEVVVSCIEPAPLEEEEEGAAAGAAEPELIGKKEEEEEDED